MSAGAIEPYGPYRPVEEVKEALRAAAREGRTPKNVRASLHPGDVPRFDREYRAALDEARETFELAPVHKFVERWWGHAMVRADPELYEATIRAGGRVERYYREQGGVPAGVSVWDEETPEVRARILRGE